MKKKAGRPPKAESQKKTKLSVTIDPVLAKRGIEFAEKDGDSFSHLLEKGLRIILRAQDENTPTKANS